MSIPGKKRDSPPPPLPPPRFIEGLNDGHDHGWAFGNPPAARDGGASPSTASVRAGSSLLGGAAGPRMTYSGPERNVDFGPADKTTPTSPHPADHSSPDAPRERMPDLGALLEYNKLQSEKQMGQRHLERSSHAYDKSIVHRLGGSAGSAATSPLAAINHEESSAIAQNTLQRMNGQVKPLNIASHPERRHSANESSAPRWSAQNTSPALSSLRSPFSDGGMDTSLYRPAEGSPAMHAYRERPGHERNESGDQSLHASDYAVDDANSPARTEGSVPHPTAASDFQQDPRTGQKRRAVSPPGSDRAPIDPRFSGSHVGPESWGRTDQHMSHSHDAKLDAQETAASSVTSSFPHTSSYAPSWTTAQSLASSATSYNSERTSPPYVTALDNKAPAYAPSSHDALQMPPPPPADNRPPPIPHRRQANSSNAPRPPGLWICDCCPKKPKKFDNEAELRGHEAEKQYQCLYCSNRFKNKNEAERHQNSLHLRRHSWSCAALTGFDMAFHATAPSSLVAPAGGPYPPQAATDTCGYCGLQFNNPPNWDERVEHLNIVHKFGECNQSKKFFRADHFRQHLKHSHAGTSGKWTNQLENACMKEEPLPQPIHSSMIAQPSQHVPQPLPPSPHGHSPLVNRPGEHAAHLPSPPPPHHPLPPR